MCQGDDVSGAQEDTIGFDVARYIEGIRRHVWLIAALVILTAIGVVVYTRQLTPIYEAKASVQIESKLHYLLDENGSVLPTGADYYRQQRTVLESETIARATVLHNDLYLRLLSEKEKATLDAPSQIDLALKRFRENLKIAYPEQNRTMLIFVRHADAQLASDLANATVSTYAAHAKGILTTDSENTTLALRKDLQVARDALNAAESALSTYLREKGLVAESLEAERSRTDASIGIASAKLNEARTRRIELGARLERFRSAAKADVLESPVLAMAGNNSFDALRAQFYLERNRFLELSQEVGPKNVEYQKAKAKMDDLYAALKAEGKRAVAASEEEFQAALTTERALADELARYKQDAKSLGDFEKDYSALAVSKKKAKDQVEEVESQLANSQKTERALDQVNTNVVPLDSARKPDKPVWPVMWNNVRVGAFLALFVGVLVSVLLTLLDRSVKSANDAAATVGAPVLGVIPLLDEPTSQNEKVRDLYVHNNPSSRIAENCRSLRTNVLFSGADRERRLLMMASANPREGKTTSAIYLGTTMAQSGQRVLLIDADMRRPRLHVSMGVPRGQGLSSLIVGEGSYDGAIKSTEVPNLYVLPCGPLPPNPAELLMTKRCNQILHELAQLYDRVILDSPPLAAVTDAVVLSKICDGVIVVARSGSTHRDDLRRAAAQVRDVDGPILGVVLNAFDTTETYGQNPYYGYGAQKETPAAS